MDATTLATLDPRDARDFIFKLYKNSPRFSGSLRSPLRQPSRSPESSRQYRPGDPVNLIDWRAFARTDELIIRQQQNQAANHLLLVLDCRSSMIWPSSEVKVDGGAHPHSQCSKLEAAVRLYFTLATAALMSGDQVSAWVIAEEALPNAVFTLRNINECRTFFDHIQGYHFDRSRILDLVHPQTFDSVRCDIGIWLSDFINGPACDPFFRSVRRPLGIHLLSSLETDITWLQPMTSYFDPIPEMTEYLGIELQETMSYAAQLAAWQNRLRQQFERHDGHYLLCTEMSSFKQITDWLQGLLV